MSRPKTPADKALKNTFAIRLTDGQLADVKARAELAGYDPREFAREIITKRQFKPKVPRGTAMELMRLRADLGRVATNVNQMAAAANRGTSIDLQSLQEVRAAIVQIADATFEFLHGKVKGYND